MQAKRASLIFAAFAAFALQANVTKAQPGQPYFAGRTINIVTPTGPGGAVALYSQIVARHLKDHIAGSPAIVVQFMPGAGGLVAANYMMSVARKDGATIGQIHASSIHAPLLGKAGFDPAQFHWLGSITPMHGVVSVLRTSPATTLEQLRGTSVPIAASSRANESSIIPELMNALLGTKFKVVQGYRGGGDMFLAMENGEAAGRVASWDSLTSEKPDWLRDGKLAHIVQYGPRNAEIPDVPSLSDLLPNPEDKLLVQVLGMGMDVGRAFYAPPGVNETALKQLEQAFSRMVRDGAFLAAAKSMRMPVDPRPGDQIAKVVKDAFAVPPSVLATLKKYISAK